MLCLPAILVRSTASSSWPSTRRTRRRAQASCGVTADGW